VTPLVSILLPAFNAAGTLAASLASVRRQTEPRWECIVVDDGSEDDTLACARAVAEVDDRVVVLAGARRGLVAALNTGLERCRGRFIARMDADDVMHRHRLAAQVAALEADATLVAVGCHVRLFPRATLRDGRRAYERWLNAIDSPRRVREDSFVECPIAHPTLTIRAATLQELRYRDLPWAEDYDLLLRLLARGDAVGVVPRRLLAWRDRPTRLSRTAARYGLARFTALKAAFLAGHFLAGADRYVLWGYGDTARALRRALVGHGKEPAHVVELHPGRLGQRIHGAPVIPPDALVRVPRRPIVVSVAGETPRRQIRAALAGMGFEELRDFVCAA
jgi:glycosyltransferase involved in cell wall biosynthesis